MSSFFGASEVDIDNCFSEILRNQRVVVSYLSFMAFFLIVVMGTDQLSPYNVLLWLALSACLLAAFLKLFLFPQRRAEAPVSTDGEQTGQEEQQIEVPPFATRQQLPDIRIQLALLDREFNESDYDALRALDTDVVPVPAMTDEQINALPCYVFGDQSPPGCTYGINRSVQHEHESSLASNEIEISSEDALECGVCLEEANKGEIVRKLPCSHQFHASCIYPWLQRHGTCPLCKCKAVCAQQQDGAV